MVGPEKKTPDADTGFVDQYRSTTCSGLLKQPDEHVSANRTCASFSMLNLFGKANR
jgi:hypothetical protein